jgi:hypothetical protein
MSTDTITAPPAPPRELSRDDAPARGLRRLTSIGLTARTVAIALLVIVAVSVFLRTRGLHFYLWIDEGLSVGIAGHPLSQIPGLLRQDGSPPLYYLLLHVWMAIRGRSEVSTHELSLLFALLSIPAAYWAASSLFDRRTGLIAAVLAAGVPYLTVYAQETRMYALMVLISVFVAASFVQVFVYRRRRHIPLFSISLTAALYTHNWGLFFGVACGGAFLWCLYAQPEDRRGLWRDGLIAFGVVVLLFAPWLPTVVYQAQHTGAPWDLPPVVWSLSQGTYFITGGRGVAMVLLLGAGVGLAALRFLPAVSGRRLIPLAPDAAPEVTRERLSAQALLILALGTYLFAWAYSKVSPAWTPRYFAVIIGPLVLLFALGLARAARFGLVALALACCFWVLDPVTHHKEVKSNVALVAAQMKPYLHSDVLALSTQPEQVPTIAYYLPKITHYATPLGPTPDPRVVDWRDALAKVERPTVHRVLMGVMAHVTPGEQVLLFLPLHFPKTPTYMKMINRASAGWSQYLNSDPRLRYVTTAYWGYKNSGVGVQAYLYDVVK